MAEGCRQCPRSSPPPHMYLLVLLSWSTRHYYKLNLLFVPSINGLISWTRHYSQEHKHFLFHVYECSKNARSEHFESSREDHAPIKTGFQRGTNMAAYMSTKHVSGKIGPKVTLLDFRNSDLISIGSLTYSLTLGFIHGIRIHGCTIAEVVKNPAHVLCEVSLYVCRKLNFKFKGVSQKLLLS